MIEPIPAFSDNYIWAIRHGGECWVVDPGDAEPVRRYLAEHGLKLAGILVTHWHADHIGGIAALTAKAPVPVLGPAAESAKIPVLTQPLVGGDRIEAAGCAWQVIAVPGHTLGHIAYYSEGVLLCGDTLFSAGCGRLFEGTPEQMHESLSQLRGLPPETQVYCAHEYTGSNLAFALAVEPDNPDVRAAVSEVRALRAEQRPSLPSTLRKERKINPFLRVDDPGVIAAARAQGAPASDPVTVFATLRRWKDHYKPPASE